MNLEDLPPKMRAQAEELLKLPKVADKVAEFISEETPNKADNKAEKALQKECENWLSLRGYLRMTANNAERQYNHPDTTCKGWFGHWFNNNRNPLMADILLVDTAGRCLMVELKVRDVWRAGQREMCKMGAWVSAFNFQEFEALVGHWELKTERFEESKEWEIEQERMET